MPAKARLAAFFWGYEPDASQLGKPQTASTSDTSIALSKDLKKRGWKFVGPTTVYAFMQAMGLINDHVEACVIRAGVARAKEKFSRPGRERTTACSCLLHPGSNVIPKALVTGRA